MHLQYRSFQHTAILMSLIQQLGFLCQSHFELPPPLEVDRVILSVMSVRWLGTSAKRLPQKRGRRFEIGLAFSNTAVACNGRITSVC